MFGGRDTRYYHDGSGLVGLYISDLIKPYKANWFLKQIILALESRSLRVVEYELNNKEVKGLADEALQLAERLQQNLVGFQWKALRLQQVWV